MATINQITTPFELAEKTVYTNTMVDTLSVLEIGGVGGLQALARHADRTGPVN